MTASRNVRGGDGLRDSFIDHERHHDANEHEQRDDHETPMCQGEVIRRVSGPIAPGTRPDSRYACT